MLDKIVIILHKPSHPGNIGAVARAMKNMGLSHLRMVQPKVVHDPETYARAAGAMDVIDHAERFDDLETALADCRCVIGASARQRTYGIPVISPREAGELARREIASLEGHAGESYAGKVGFLFGTESSGLSNEDLLRCQYHLTIPTNPDFSSLNIAAAVQLVAYEIFIASLSSASGDDGVVSDIETVEPKEPWATNEQLEGFFAHLEKTLGDIGVLAVGNPRQFMAHMRRLYHRARLTEREVNMLRGILTAASRHQEPV